MSSFPHFSGTSLLGYWNFTVSCTCHIQIIFAKVVVFQSGQCLWNNFIFLNLFIGISIKYMEINWYCLNLPRWIMKWCPNRMTWVKFVHSLSWGNFTHQTTLLKLYSALRINPYKWTFPNCDISCITCIMDQSTNKTTNESNFTCSVWKKNVLFWEPCCSLGNKP